MEYYCKSCATMQYSEDLGRCYSRQDDEHFVVCGYCYSDEIVELDVVEVAHELHGHILFLASQLYGRDDPRFNQYMHSTNSLCEWLEEMT